MFFISLCAIYFLYLFMDAASVFPQLSSVLKFASVLICFFYALIQKAETTLRSQRADGGFYTTTHAGMHPDTAVFTVMSRTADFPASRLSLILAVTAAADFFLVLTPFYLTGVTIFVIVQLLYHTMLCSLDHFPLWHLAGTGCAAAVILLPLCLRPDFQLIFFPAAVYFLLLLQNLIFCVKKRDLTLSCGFALIMLCDINVGIFNLFPNAFSSAAMWFFYLPGQFLLTSYFADITCRAAL